MSGSLHMPLMARPVNRTDGAARLSDRRAFSLIEVVFALAVFSFSILAIVGLMASGLNSAATSSSTLATANIQRVIRANFEATTNVIGVASTPNYFTSAGFSTVLSPTSGDDAPYYTVSYTLANPTKSLITSTAADVVLVSVLYPYPVNAHTNIFSLFITP